MIDRRQWMFGAMAGAGLLACARPKGAPVAAAKPRAPKSILVLGGTGFLGPHVVTAARARGHTLTLFNRGKTHPGLFPGIEKLVGDRDGKLDALKGRTWDAVVDTSGFVPRIVKQSAELLAPHVQHYVFISTISVYRDMARVGADETAAVETIADVTNEDVKTNYGALKALCERAAEAAMPGRVATLRPGLIVGPGDPTGRYTHWPVRLSEGGKALAPGDGTTPVQWIDGRDLGRWIVQVIEDGTVGTYNALGPAKRTTVKQMLDGTNAAVGGKAELVWVPEDVLEQAGVQGWSELPMWLPAKGDMAGFGTTSNAKAVAAGLVFRGIEETARDVLAWLATLPEAERAKVADSGLARDKEQAVLAKLG